MNLQGPTVGIHTSFREPEEVLLLLHEPGSTTCEFIVYNALGEPSSLSNNYVSLVTRYSFGS